MFILFIYKPVATRSRTSSSMGVETTDLVITRTFSMPISTTRYGNTSLYTTQGNYVSINESFLF